MRILPVVFTCIVLFFSGCTEKPDAKLNRGVALAEKTFKALHTDAAARLSFQDIIGQGASLVTVVTANAPNGADLPPFADGEPTKPWSVVLWHDEDSNEAVIDGYGEDLETPLVTRRVRLPDDPQ